MSPAPIYCNTCGAANSLESKACFACQQPLGANTGDEATDNPLLHARYQLLTQAGTGGFGAVYKAIDTQNAQCIVAVKQINLRGLSTQEVIEATDAFNREVVLLSDLEHPNLPRIHDHFTD